MAQDKSWTAKEIRQQFLDFFQNKGHEVVPSAPMVIKGDPTLMFTNAGMNQFKEAFLGNRQPSSSRITDTQKCLRVSGKHNDLEEVGHDTYHHTMFEMLGNWSFGDYFKTEAIAWAWELLTEVYGLDQERLYVTVFEGDASENLERDDDAANAWKAYVPQERILNGNKKDNFWEMGATGPCGPCSEIHMDLRSNEERAKVEGASLVNQDHPQVVEIWNLVFMEFNRQADGALKALPAKHVDTGMGFERLCMALQGKQSNYDTDVFQPLITRLSELSGITYGTAEKSDIALRVIADHVRAVAFAIADGQLPSNNGAGYVIRRILRRAIRYGFSYLNLKEAFIHKLIPILSQQMAEFFPEIRDQKELVEKVILEEEQSFLRTLEQGLNRLDQIRQESQSKTVDGARVFELYDTFGFPPDLTALILKEEGMSFDIASYESEMQKQKDRARSATKVDTGDWVVIEEDDREEFIGYDHLEAKVRITRYRKVKAKNKESFQIVLNLTPFYPEGGGQVGDHGKLISENEEISIYDTKKEHGLIIHFCDKLPENPQAEFKARVDSKRQKSTSLNHTATHLLHQALREVLGTHVEQKGSLVNPDYLRFDFSHFSKVEDEQLAEIERLVNQRIRANFPLEEYRSIPMDEAKEMGAIALFGEKYGDLVRAIKFGDSVELCGGIHVQASGEIGLFTLMSEGAVAAGIRRIEACTGDAALQYLNEKASLLSSLQQELKNPKDPLAGLLKLKEENAQLKKQVEAFQQAQAAQERKAWAQAIESIDGVDRLILETSLDAKSIKDALFQLKADKPQLAAVIASKNDGKANIAVALGDAILASKDWKAGNLVKELAAEIGGGGGGQAGFAMAGGSKPEGIEQALAKAKTLLQ
ncbi:alanine--tRNA ligase [Croceimicrobium hydrocarbonivorans]|uniref:Alanine--tRNA ligase n=1 Tax=Croceimicrobium hydrocarbonivorans TaxID=2761580 RepID=A0A7H0VB15_9FLAO|nr:alanine--tRNA ligase [Croceimicrobium hydrocarbonivorans]QNR22913.1 alanine--tRNA ligase [Croceimicrobium hydrocarbonivorans]